MSDLIDERYMRFHALYFGIFNEPFDVSEFIADDLYAFRAFERALRGDNQKLRNLAAHLQVERQANMESITLTPHQALAKTRKLKLLTTRDPDDDSTEELPPPEIPPDRVKGPGRPSPAEISLLATFRRIFVALMATRWTWARSCSTRNMARTLSRGYLGQLTMN